MFSPIYAYEAPSGDPPAYPEVSDSTTLRTKAIRPDQFFGKGLATAVKEFPKMNGSAATAEEIYDALLKGGYEFTGNKKLWFRGLTISLSKNTQTFLFLKNSNSFGLLSSTLNLSEKKRTKKPQNKRMNKLKS